MRRILVPGICLIAAASLFLLCGKGESKKAVLVIGKDSLQIEQVRALVPETAPDSQKIRLVTCRYLLGQALPAGLKTDDATAAKLSKKLALISGLEYSPAAAGLLLDAAAALDARVRSAATAAEALAAVDTLASSVPAAAAGNRPCCMVAAADRARLGSMDVRDRKFTAVFCASVLGISRETAETVVSFIPAAAGQDMGNIADLVQGLVADTAKRSRKKAREPVQEVADNSVEALKFRPQQSIRDSIGRHLPNLQQMYKRSLKTNAMISGVVWVTFRVGAEGRVISVKIKSSQIDNRAFLQRILDYSKTIQFKPVPKTAGNMTFEFPFEFTAEE